MLIVLCHASLLLVLVLSFFFFNDTATTEIYTLSLHDALPISSPATSRTRRSSRPSTCTSASRGSTSPARPGSRRRSSPSRSPCSARPTPASAGARAMSRDRLRRLGRTLGRTALILAAASYLALLVGLPLVNV